MSSKRYKAVLFSILMPCSIYLAQATTAEQYYALIDNQVAASASTEQRIVQLSASLLGAPYVDGNLGEGEFGQYDRDPLYRFDVFDCTTYVEAVLAGALSTSSHDFADNINKIRYQDGLVSFVTRNHFASADWLPNNQGLLQDITTQVGQAETLIATTVIDKPAWYQAMKEDRLQSLPDSVNKQERLDALHHEGQAFQAQSVSTAYVPLTAVFQGDQINQALLDRIPNGSIISMVRPDYDVKKWIGTNLNITHQSIAVRKDGQLFLRHASQLKKEVTDEDFIEYFAKYRDHATLKGFNVQQAHF